MADPAPWIVDDIDRRARNAALAAARRAGMPVGEWLSEIIAEQAGAAAASWDEDEASAEEDLAVIPAAARASAKLRALSRASDREETEIRGGPRRVAAEPLERRGRRMPPRALPIEEEFDAELEAVLDDLERRNEERDRATAGALSMISEWMKGQLSELRRDRESIAWLRSRIKDAQTRKGARQNESSEASGRNPRAVAFDPPRGSAQPMHRQPQSRLA